MRRNEAVAEEVAPVVELPVAAARRQRTVPLSTVLLLFAHWIVIGALLWYAAAGRYWAAGVDNGVKSCVMAWQGSQITVVGKGVKVK